VRLPFTWGVRAVVLISGASVMAIEVLGARVLAPHFGTSHFVWIAQLSVTLIALSCGYVLGGALAVRNAGYRFLCEALAVSGLYLAFAVAVAVPLARALEPLPLSVGAILAALVLYYVPLTMLGTVCPVAAELLIKSRSGPARFGGTLALSTLGSLAGTMLVGYVMIPRLANSLGLLMFSGLLCASGMLGVGRWRVLGCLVAWLVGAALVFHRSGVPGKTLVYLGGSSYGELAVVDDEQLHRRYLYNDALMQNRYDLAAKRGAMAATSTLVELANRSVGRGQRVLIIGLGVGVVPTAMVERGCMVDVAEINEAIVDLATRYFDLDADKLNISMVDGRRFLCRTPSRYRCIVVDAFAGECQPAHLMTAEFFELVRSRLEPAGTLVMNSFGGLSGSEALQTFSIYRTLRTQFSEVQGFASPAGNVFFVASNQAIPAMGTLDLSDVPMDVASNVESTLANAVQWKDGVGLCLTDDFNPMDYWDASARQERRRRMAQFHYW